MTRIGVIGPGAIGGTVAAWLCQSTGHAVTLCARTRFDRLDVDSPEGSIAAQPEIFTNPAEAKPVDWVLIATKTYDAAATGLWLPSLVAPHTCVVVLQNGVEHVARFAPYLPSDRILPAVVDIPAERSEPGRIRQRRNGWIVVPAGADGDAFAALFGGTPIDVSTTPDFLTVAWTKLALNCAGAISTLVLQPAGVVWRDDIADIQRQMVRECLAVGRAAGATLPDDLPDTVIRRYREGPRDSINSMHADRLSHRPMELDARNGVIVRLGAVHGIPTPVNAMIYALLEAAAA